MTKLKKVKICGEGTYGIVYEAVVNATTSSNNSKRYAVKRNFSEKKVTGVWSVRELDLLTKLKGHPFIVNLEATSNGDPFYSNNPMTPRREEVKNMREDKIHFVMEYVETTCTRYISKHDICKPDDIKAMITQLILGIEYIHKRGITHRDLKPDNLLINCKENGVRIKIADYGMSQILTKSENSSSDVVTSWYRAPEICCGFTKYDCISDMWSIGCIIYEMISSVPYLYNVDDNSCAIFNTILGYSEKPVDNEVVKSMFSNAKFKMNSSAIPMTRISLLERIKFHRMSVTGDIHGTKFKLFVEKFNETYGSFNDVIDLISKLLTVDPAKRPSSTDILKHPFFIGTQDYCSTIREIYNPETPNLEIVTIIKCVERKWMKNLATQIFNNKSNFIWYSHRVLFHAVELFDRYLTWCFDSKNEILTRKNETTLLGKIHSKSEVEIRFYTLLYLMYKYFLVMITPISYKDLCDKKYHSNDNIVEAEKFELHFIHDVSKHLIYKPTVFEMPEYYGHTINEKLVNELFMGYINIEQWDSMSCRAIYRHVVGIDLQGKKIPKPLPVNLDITSLSLSPTN